MKLIALRNLQKKKWDKNKPDYRIFARSGDGAINMKSVGCIYKRKDQYGFMCLGLYLCARKLIAFQNRKTKWEKNKPDFRIFARNDDGKISRKPLGCIYKRKDCYGFVYLSIYLYEKKEGKIENTNNFHSDNNLDSFGNGQTKTGSNYDREDS